MSGTQAIHSDLAERTAAATALLICVWLVLIVGTALVALAIKDSEAREREQTLRRVHQDGVAAGYQWCKSEGR